MWDAEKSTQRRNHMAEEMRITFHATYEAKRNLRYHFGRLRRLVKITRTSDGIIAVARPTADHTELWNKVNTASSWPGVLSAQIDLRNNNTVSE